MRWGFLVLTTIGYGSADIGRTRFAASPLLHLFHGAHTNSHASMLRQRWWRDARRNVPGRAAALLELINMAPHYIPAFLTPEIDSAGTAVRRSLDVELEALREASEDSIAYDVMQADGISSPASPLVHQVSQSGTSGVAQLVDAARALFTACLADDWPDMQRLLEQEITARAHQMATCGVTGVLNDLNPRLSWADDSLIFNAPRPPGVRPTVAGRGFVLLPNLMTQGFQILLVECHQPLMGYHVVPGQDGARSGPSALGALIGSGRERALRAIGTGCGTAELGVRLGIKPPAASAHAAALRASCLVVTIRKGRAVRHVLTQLGTDLLAANPR